MMAWLEGYRAAREKAAWAEVPADVLTFSGPDRRKFLHGMLSADVLGLGAWRGAWTCVLTPKGKLVARFALYDAGELLLAVAEPGTAGAIAAALSKALPLSQTKLSDESRAWRAFSLLGPAAGEAAARLAGGPCPRDFGAARAPVAGADCWLLSYPALSPEQLLLLIPEPGRASARAALERALGEELAPEAREALRLEGGIPRAGVDYDAESYPLELGMEPALSFTKGCYLGQETAAMMKNRGRVNRRLVGLASEAPIAAGAAVEHAGADAGRAGGGAFSPALGRRLSLALLRSSSAVSGLRVRAGGVEAEVVALPVRGPSGV